MPDACSLIPCLRPSVTPFTSADLAEARDALGCNCGPAALAFAAGVDPALAVNAIPGFIRKRFTTPTMMRSGLRWLGLGWDMEPPGRAGEATLVQATGQCTVAIVRIQFGGPWTQPGANPRWAYRHTHWICGWLGYRDNERWVYDINGPSSDENSGRQGVMTAQEWAETIAPAIAAQTPRASGAWWPVDVWRLRRVPGGGAAE